MSDDRLAQAIEAYRGGRELDEHANAVLDRLLFPPVANPNDAGAAKAFKANPADAARAAKAEKERIKKAFEAVATDDPGGEHIIKACIGAEELTRTFRRRIENERGLSEKLDRLSNHVTELRAFISDICDAEPERTKPNRPLDAPERLKQDERIIPRRADRSATMKAFSFADATDAKAWEDAISATRDEIAATSKAYEKHYGKHAAMTRDHRIVPRRRGPLAAYVIVSERQTQQAKQGFDVIQSWILSRRDLHDELMKIATRKSKGDSAGEIAAIRLLSKHVHEASGEWHDSHVAVLAEIAIGLRHEIDPERVRKARRA